MEKLNAFKKQKIKAVILLEAVISLAIFTSTATLLLGQIQESRKREVELLKQEEILRVARIALQTGQKQLTVNGLTVHVVSNERSLEVYHGTEKLLAIQDK
ncbi:competence type IV pilus minor pilin ComGE [Streptococcus timonensis]|uniref:competence type IV pilus minor pilin ComGE n=1 Tax=Streptococcus timonensis TaxID=1852387 RepID=UPI00094EA6E0|nr:competence type IV pilus minor pilin ComGE [Streptococcus timonensis]